MDTLKDLSLENLYEAIHPKPPGLKEKTRWSLNPFVPIIQNQWGVVRPNPRDLLQRTQGKHLLPSRRDEDPI
jgi:hypothetical protein